MLNFKKAGSGKQTLVLLHGWGGSWGSWTPIIDKLKTKFTVYALDLPGFGLSNITRPYTTRDYADSLVSFFAKNAINKPVVIGHSFGGQIACRLAIDYPENLGGLILVDAAIVRNNHIPVLLNIAVAELGKRIITKTPLKHFYRQLRNHYYRLRRMETSDYHRIEDNPPLSQTLSQIMRENLLPVCYKITVPTLLIWGEKDPTELTPVKHAREIHHIIKNSKLVVIPEAGHFSYLDAPDRFVAEVTNFANKL